LASEKEAGISDIFSCCFAQIIGERW